MAAVNRKPIRGGNSHMFHWVLTTADPTGDAAANPGAPDKSFQFTGAFGGTGVATIEGSNDGGTTWWPLHDGSNTVIGATAAGGGAILENCELFRARLSTVGTNAAIDAYVFARSA